MIIYKNKNLVIPVGLGPNFNEDSEEILNQNKTVDSSTNYQRIYPDAGFTGLGRVTVNPYILDSKTVDSSTELQLVTSDKDGLYRVVVNPYSLDELTLDSSTEMQVSTGGYNKVTVNPYTLDEKTVDSSTNSQVITSDADGLRQVTVNPLVLNPLEVDSSTATQMYPGVHGTVTVNPYTLDSKTVDSSTNSQVVTSSVNGLSAVTVNPYVLDSKTVDPSTNQQTVTSSEDGLESVTVNPVTSSIDSNIAAGNIKSGVSILGIQGTFAGGTLQNKTVDSSTVSQIVIPDSGNYGLGQVTVNPYNLDSSSAIVTANGNYLFTSSADGLSRVDVSVNIDTQSYYDSGYSDGTAAQKAKLESIVFTANGVYSREDGWNEVEVAVPSNINNQNKTVDSSTNSQSVTFDSGYTGLGTVIINPVTSSIDSNIIAGNIKSGVSILGVQGTFAGGTLGTKTVDSSTNSQTVTPNSGDYGLSAVTVNPYTLDSKTVDSSTNSQVVTSDADGLLRVTINPLVLSSLELDSSTATQESTGLYNSVRVNPYTLDSKTVDSSTNSQVVTSDADGLRQVTVNPYTLDSSTLSITNNGSYSVTSSADGLSRVDVDVAVPIPTFNTQSKTVDSSTTTQTVTPSTGYDGLSAVTVNAVTSSIDSNIIARNIKKDITILGVTGTFEGSSTPTAAPVEYISNEDDLNLVFNTGYVPDSSTKIIANISFGDEGLGNFGNFFGVSDVYALREWGGYGGGMHAQLAGNLLSTGITLSTPADLDTVLNIELGNFYTNIDGTYSSSGEQTVSTTSPIFLFASCVNGSVSVGELTSREMRIHSFTIYEDSTLVKNLVPYQDASSNGCFFDTVSQTYIYPLQGTPTIGPLAIYQNKLVDASTNSIEVTADSGYEALGKVTINPVAASIDSDIIPSNIASGVNILGVVGTFSGAIYHRVGYVSNNATNKKIYRNTGILPTNNTRIEATVSFEDIASGESGYGYLWGTTNGASFCVREFGGYGSRNVSYFDANGTSYWSSDMSSAPRTYVHGQVENDYSFMSYGGYIDKRSAWSYTWSSGDEIFIWAANKGDTAVDEYATRVMRVYEFKIYEGDTLVFHGVPVADNSNHYAFLDLVSNTLVEGSGELTGGGVYIEPDEDNYILNTDSSSGTNAAYFDLGTTDYMDISDTSNIKLYIEVIGSNPSNDNTVVYFGAVEGQRYMSIMSNTQSGVSYVQYGYGNYSFMPGGQVSSPVNKYTLIDFYNNNPTYVGKRTCLYVNGVPKSTSNIRSNITTNMSYSPYIFALNANGTVSSQSAGQTKIYQIKYYNTDDGEVHVLVPAYNNGEYCFHDLISNTYLYAVSGTATGHVKNHFLTDNGAIDIYTA